MEELSSKATEILELAFSQISDANYEDKAEIQIGGTFTLLDKIEFEELCQSLVDCNIVSPETVAAKNFTDIVEIKNPDEYWHNIMESALEYLRNAVADETKPLVEEMNETHKSANEIDPNIVSAVIDELSIFAQQYRIPDGFWQNVTDIDNIIQHI